MRRRTAPVLLALFLLAPTLPAQAAQPVVVTGDDAVSSPSVEPTDPGAESSPSEAPDDPVAESVPSAEPTASATPTASADPEPASVPKPSAGTDGDVAEPTATPSAAPSGSPAASRADPSGRWIVMLKPQADVAAVSARQSRTAGVRPQAVFGNLRAYTASLNAAQRRALAADSSVMAVVPDERIELTAQTIPNGIRRISGRSSTMAAIDGVDQRVNADVAIVDTGIDASHPDLNVAGGVNCSTSDRTQWRDVQGHGTHVAGTVAAKDNGYGVVGVAPGARLWAVKILDDTGTGLLSWYVCGLDWIAAQRDPVDSSRPLIEAVNMSVAKWGSDDRNCGLSNNDVLHQAICRVVAKNITVVAAAANDSGSASKRVPAAYDEVITVSALADTDGKPGGLGGPSCWSWGGYDKDDTFADFSNYGSDVDIIAPGKCIWSSLPGNRYGYSSGTSMAAPHVTGAAALYKATRPWATPAEVREALRYLGNSNWITSSDPDGDPEPLLDVARVGAYGTFSLLASTSSVLTNEAGTSRTLPVTLVRSATHFERVILSVSAPSAIGATIDRTNVYGFGNLAFNLALSVPRSTPGGTYPVVVTATEHGRVQTATVDVVVENDPPKVGAPSMTIVGGSKLGTPTVSLKVSWPAATDPSSAISSYRVERSVDGAAWVGIGSFGPGTRSLATGGAPGHRYQYRVRATDAAGNPSAWAVSPAYTLRAIQDGSLAYSGKWYRASATAAYGGTTRYSVRAGASARAYVTARQVAIVAPMSAKRGKARIYVDGVHVATIDLYRSALSSRRVVWLKTFPTNARRLIEVRVVGTSGRPRVDVDAIIAVGW